VREWRGESGPQQAEVILAGRSKFPEVWARDAAFAVPALLRLGRHEVVRNTLEAFFDLQRPDGKLPRRLSGTSNLGRNLRAGLRNWFGIDLSTPTHLHPEFLTSGSRILWHRGHPKDVNPLLLGATAAYVSATGDVGFAAQRREKIAAALGYLRRVERAGLIWQHHYEDWEDHTAHTGHGLFTNVLHYQALRALAALEEPWSAGEREELASWAEAMREALQRLWLEEEGYFADFIGGRARHIPFSVAGNMLAIEAGVAGPEQRPRVMDNLAAIVADYGYVPITAPGLPVSRTSLLRFPFVRHYLSGRLLLPWIQLLAARAVAPWRPELAFTLTHQVAEPMIGYRTCLEALHEGRTPLRFFFTTQEYSFSWGSAALIETCAVLEGLAEGEGFSSVPGAPREDLPVPSARSASAEATGGS
jgi:hypothetical protein